MNHPLGLAAPKPWRRRGIVAHEAIVIEPARAFFRAVEPEAERNNASRAALTTKADLKVRLYERSASTSGPPLRAIRLYEASIRTAEL